MDDRGFSVPFIKLLNSGDRDHTPFTHTQIYMYTLREAWLPALNPEQKWEPLGSKIQQRGCVLRATQRPGRPVSGCWEEEMFTYKRFPVHARVRIYTETYMHTYP